MILPVRADFLNARSRGSGPHRQGSARSAPLSVRIVLGIPLNGSCRTSQKLVIRKAGAPGRFCGLTL